MASWFYDMPFPKRKQNNYVVDIQDSKQVIQIKMFSSI